VNLLKNKIKLSVRFLSILSLGCDCVIVDRWAEHLSWVVLTDGQTICDDVTTCGDVNCDDVVSIVMMHEVNDMNLG
jgi:hypothetical protein